MAMTLAPTGLIVRALAHPNELLVSLSCPSFQHFTWMPLGFARLSVADYALP
jgi:hypothetical protein